MVTVQSIRDYIRDVTAADHPVLLKQAFTESEIETAMAAAAREYNSTPPYIGPDIDWRTMPDRTNVFFDGTVAALFRTKIAQLSQDEIDYSGGSVSVKVTGVRLAHLKELAQQYQNRFLQHALSIKKNNNVRQGYGQIG